MIGDTPYGAAQLTAFPTLIESINADPKVRLAVHVGDIKNGSSRCDDSYYETIAGDFDGFKDPLVYTPGDNEWTDCHRANNGGYNPIEPARARSRDVLLRAGHDPRWPQDAGAVSAGLSQRTSSGWSRRSCSRPSTSSLNNGYAPWTGNAAATPEQRAEVNARIAADLDWIGAAFDAAEENDALGVVLAMQADTFEGANETLDGFDGSSRGSRRGGRIRRSVVLLQGDTHWYTVDAPYATAPNLTRIVVQGETASEWLRLTVDPRADELFSWERVRLDG